MTTVLLVIYITAAVSMIVLILLQRSEGGALGMGGGGGGGFVSGRGAVNFMTRTTAILAAIFFVTAILLSILGHKPEPSSTVIGSGAVSPAKEEGAAPAQEKAPNTSLPPLRMPKLVPDTAPQQSSPAAPSMPQLPQSQ